LLSPGLLESLAYNINRGMKNLRMFEVGKVFYKADTLAEEPVFAGCVLTGRERDYFWRGASPELDFFDLKGVLEGMFDSFGFLLKVKETAEPFLNKYNASDLFVGDVKTGWAGELRQEVLAAYGIEQKVYAAEVDLTVVAERWLKERKYQPIPRYPSVVRDFSFLIEPGISVGSLMDRIRTVSPLIVSVGLFDLFKREKTSVAFRVTFQSLEDTLRDETVNELQEVIIRALTQIEGVQLRA